MMVSGYQRNATKDKKVNKICMLYFDAPVTHDRYLAEITNLLYFKCRPLCIQGKPRATIHQIARNIKSSCVINNTCFCDKGTIVITKEYLLILNINSKLASIQISNSE